MSAVSRKVAYKILKPLLHAFLKKQLAAKEDALEMAKQMGFSNHVMDTQRNVPGQIELLKELPAELDREMEA